MTSSQVQRLAAAIALAAALVAGSAHAQGRLEVDVAVGTQTYLNDLDPDPGSAGTFAVGVAWQLTGPHSVWARYASAAYEISYFDGSTEAEAVGNILAGYRYTFRHEQILRPYLEIGIGASDPIIGFDTGSKSAGAAAFGLQWLKWREGMTGVFIEYRSVAWDQDDTPDVAEFLLGVQGDDVGVQSAEFTVGLIGRFL